MDDYRSYGVPRVSEQKAKVAPARGGGNDIKMQQPPPVGGQKNAAASRDLAAEFNAEADLATLIRAQKIRANKARLGAALQVGERRSNMRLSMGKSDGPVGERGPTGLRTARAGSPARGPNKFENRGLSAGTNGTRADGGRGRW
jgi:hypothetical protein